MNSDRLLLDIFSFKDTVMQHDPEACEECENYSQKPSEHFCVMFKKAPEQLCFHFEKISLRRH